jgi:acyl-CoA thioester hydrolase
MLDGVIRNGIHYLKIRVYFEDTDFSGLVYHASYLRWCERERSSFLRHSGTDHRSLMDGTLTGIACAFAVHRIEADFIKPARIDDIIDVTTQTANITKASLTLSQHIWREQLLLTRLTAQCVLLDLSGKLLRLPPALTATIPRPGHS